MNPAGNPVTLRPAWQPGQSGNNRGYNGKYRALLRLSRLSSPEMLQLAIDCARDTEAAWPARLTAISLVLDRAWGRPKETITLGDGGIGTLRIEFVDPRNNGAVIDASTFEVSFTEQNEEES